MPCIGDLTGPLLLFDSIAQRMPLQDRSFRARVRGDAPASRPYCRQAALSMLVLAVLVVAGSFMRGVDGPEPERELLLEGAHRLSGAVRLLSGLGLSMGRPAPEHHEHASMGRALPQRDERVGMGRLAPEHNDDRGSLVSSTSPPPSLPCPPPHPPQPPRPPPSYPPFQPSPSPSPTVASKTIVPHTRVDGSIKDNCAECQLGTYLVPQKCNCENRLGSARGELGRSMGGAAPGAAGPQAVTDPVQCRLAHRSQRRFPVRVLPLVLLAVTLAPVVQVDALSDACDELQPLRTSSVTTIPTNGPALPSMVLPHGLTTSNGQRAFACFRLN